MIRFRLRLRAVSLLTVGWGIPDVLGADIVTARKVKADGTYEYYVPGSTVKGVLRSAASRVAGAYGFTSCGEVDPEKVRKAHEAMGGPCDVCTLFGYPYPSVEGASKVYVSDFSPVGRPAPVIVARTALRDDTQTVREGSLRSVEHLLPGSEFVGEVRVDGAASRLVPLLLLAVAELRTSRVGRGSLVDARVEDGGALDAVVAPEWRGLLEGVRSWLWEGVV
ncbi:RAMP superfamily CRISPR-associated protein [Thermofilum pendens]|uniref:RAMP superfamily CRISPR-associated protein n=1 Tax=Thermofilum pendens TaxID=2269 RepID=UPI001FE206C9|nr:RAMP superfamily CRISPR-associated protein [Thermofilum pendens]